MFNCTDCCYSSNRKLNLLSHTNRKHSRELKDNEKINKKPLEIEVNYNSKNIEIKEKYKCEKCTKVLKTKNNLTNHIKICKGVLNPLECHYCHKILANSSSKSQHIKTCKAKKENALKEELEKKALEEEVLPIVKKKKNKISILLRQTVWDKWIGEDFGTSKCWCCKKNQIRQMNFDCGHVVSEYEGGEAILKNLRPICRICNSSMQTENMIEFMERLNL